MRTHRSGAEPGHFGEQFVAQRAQTRRSAAGEGTPASSANDTWMPRAASWEATAARSRAGTRTITPTARWPVLTCLSGCTRSTFAARAVTSSVDIIHEPTPSSSASCVATATSRSRQQRDRAHAPRRVEHHVRGGRPIALPLERRIGLGRRARRRRSSPSRARAARRCRWRAAAGRSAAIARVFRRAWPTGSP